MLARWYCDIHQVYATHWRCVTLAYFKRSQASKYLVHNFKSVEATRNKWIKSDSLADKGLASLVARITPWLRLKHCTNINPMCRVWGDLFKKYYQKFSSISCCKIISERQYLLEKKFRHRSDMIRLSRKSNNNHKQKNNFVTRAAGLDLKCDVLKHNSSWLVIFLFIAFY